MPERSPRYQTNIQHAQGTVIGEHNTVNQHFYAGIPAFSTDYASRIQNFLTEYLGTPEQPVPFGGREADLARLDAWLEDPKAPPYALLAAPAGRGKSALLVQWTRVLLKRQDLAVVFFPISIRFRTNLATVVFASLAARLAALHGETVPTSPNMSVEVWRDLVHQYLNRPLPDGKRVVLALDALDEAAWEVGADLFPSVPTSGVRVLVSTRLLVGDADATAWLRRLGWERQGRAYAQELLTLPQKALVEVLRSMGAPLDQLGNQWAIIQELFRLTEGDPLLIRLYVEALWEQRDSTLKLRPEDLSQLRPGLEGYFARWWEEQQKLWGKRTLPGKRVEEVLNLLACALGPLSQEDLLRLVSPTLKMTSWALEEVLRPLHRLVLGDGRSQGYVFSHPRLAGYFFSERLTQRERQAVEQRFLQWGAETLAAMNAGQLMPEEAAPYLLQYYGAHLERSQVDVSLLLALVSQGWQRAWEQYEGTYAGFFQDTTRAWRAAEREDGRAISAGGPAPYLGGEVYCALCQVSMMSLATNIPPTLLVNLVRERYWSGPQGLAYARQVSDPKQRAEVLRELLPLLPTSLKIEGMQASLGAAQAIKDEVYRVRALQELAPLLPEEQQVPILEEALGAAQAIKDEIYQARALQELAPLLPERLLAQALEATRVIKHEWARAETLRTLVSLLPEGQQQLLQGEALKVAQAIKDEKYRFEALQGLALQVQKKQLQPAPEEKLKAAQTISPERDDFQTRQELVQMPPERVLAQALEVARDTHFDRVRAQRLSVLVPLLPREQQQFVLEEALKAAQANKTIYKKLSFVEALGMLVPLLPQEQRKPILEEALEVAQLILDRESRIEALSALVPLLPQEQRQPVLWEVVRAAQSIWDERYLIRALRELVPVLSEDSLPQALEAARAIRDQRNRIGVLSALVPLLPEEQRQPVTEEALRTARTIENAYYRVQALQKLVPVLSEGLLPQALEAARAIKEDKYCRIDQALRELVAVLPEERQRPVLEEALRAARTIKDAYDQVEALQGFVPILPEEQRPSVLEEALEDARAIKEERNLYFALRKLVPVLPKGLLPEALEIARAIRNERERLWALRDLAPVLPKDLLSEAVIAAQAIRDTSSRIEALSVLLLELPEEQRQPLIEGTLRAARTIKDAKERFKALRQLVPVLPEELRQSILGEVLRVPRSIWDEWTRFHELSELAPLLPEEQRQPVLEEALKAAGAIKEGRHCSRALRDLMPLLPENLLPQALKAVQTIRDVRFRSEALCVLTPLLPEDQRQSLLEEALKATRAITGAKYTSQALQHLVPVLPQALLPEALEIIQSTDDEQVRASMLALLLPKLSSFSQQALYHFWLQMLRRSAQRTRSDFLADLSAFAPLLSTLGGPEAVAQAVAAIQMVSQWWP